MKSNICAIALICLIGPVMGFFISTNTFAQGAVRSDGEDTVIKSGVYYSVLGNTVSSLLGFRNEGRFFLTGSKRGTTSLVTSGGSFINSGVTSCDTSRSKENTYYSIKPKRVFRNSGRMYLGLGEVATSAVGFTITAASTWTNTGMIVLKSLSKPCSANIGGTTVANEGSICLYKTLWSPLNSIQGRGCIAVNAGSSFTTVASRTTITSSQIIHLGHASASVIVGGFVSLVGSLFRGLVPAYTVAGFGGGNRIVVGFLFRSYSYNTNTGFLTLVGLLHKASFNIGLGYDPRSFRPDASLLGLASKGISYSKACPNSPPPRCVCEPEFPTAPSSTATTASTAMPVASTVSTSMMEWTSASYTDVDPTPTFATIEDEMIPTPTFATIEDEIDPSATFVTVEDETATPTSPTTEAEIELASYTSTSEEVAATTEPVDDDNWT